jgi:hypothetical protein
MKLAPPISTAAAKAVHVRCADMLNVRVVRSGVRSCLPRVDQRDARRFEVRSVARGECNLLALACGYPDITLSIHSM